MLELTDSQTTVVRGRVQELFFARAQQVAIVLGDSRGIHRCAQRRQVERRSTFLSLLGEVKEEGGLQ